MKKTYVIDTSVIMHDPLFYQKFDDNNIVIPIFCLEELRKLKNAPGLKGFQAREAARKIKELFGPGVTSVVEGVKLENGGCLKIELNNMDLSVLPNALDQGVTDYKIVSIAKTLSNKEDADVIMVSKDIDIWIICKALGVQVEDYMHDRIDTDEMFDGIIEKSMIGEGINKLYKDHEVMVPSDFLVENEKLYPNLGIVLNPHSQSALAIYSDNKIKLLPKNNLPYLKGRNMEQKMAINLLNDDSINLVTITGGAGSGKTYLATAVAFHKLLSTHDYNKLILIKPTQETDLGFLPGSEQEKLDPYMASYYDTFNKVLPPYVHGIFDHGSVKNSIMTLVEEGRLEMKNFSYLRGRSLDDSLIIVDECQQITPHFAKLILTRAGMNTKIIMLGDISDNQIDVKYVDSKSNGLAYVVEKFKNSSLAGHVTLKSVERSPLANEAEKIL